MMNYGQINYGANMPVLADIITTKNNIPSQVSYQQNQRNLEILIYIIY